MAANLTDWIDPDLGGGRLQPLAPRRIISRHGALFAHRLAFTLRKLKEVRAQ
jgi:hypothetical protein